MPNIYELHDAAFANVSAYVRVRLNSGGYDSGGAYWGIGLPLYWAQTPATFDHDGADWFLRAYDRAAAKEAVRERFPNARFYR